MGLKDCLDANSVPEDIRAEIESYGGDSAAVEQYLQDTRQSLVALAEEVGVSVDTGAPDAAFSIRPDAQAAETFGRTAEEQEAQTFGDEAVQRNLEGQRPRLIRGTTDPAQASIARGRLEQDTTVDTEEDIVEQGERLLRKLNPDRKRAIAELRKRLNTKIDNGVSPTLAEEGALQIAIDEQSKTVAETRGTGWRAVGANRVLNELNNIFDHFNTKAAKWLALSKMTKMITPERRLTHLMSTITELPNNVSREVGRLRRENRAGAAERAAQEALARQMERFETLLRKQGLDPDEVLTQEFMENADEDTLFSIRGAADAAKAGTNYLALLSYGAIQNMMGIGSIMIGPPTTAAVAAASSVETAFQAAVNEALALINKDSVHMPRMGDIASKRLVAYAMKQAPKAVVNAARALWSGRSPLLNSLGLEDDEISYAQEGFSDPAREAFPANNLAQLAASPVWRPMGALDEFMMSAISGAALPMHAAMIARERGLSGALAEQFIDQQLDPRTRDSEVGERTRLTVEKRTFKNIGDPDTFFGDLMNRADKARSAGKSKLGGIQPLRHFVPFFRTGVRTAEEVGRRSPLAPIFLGVDVMELISASRQNDLTPADRKKLVGKRARQVYAQSAATLLAYGAYSMLAGDFDDEEIKDMQKAIVELGGKRRDISRYDPLAGWIKSAGDFLAWQEGDISAETAADRVLGNLAGAITNYRSLQGLMAEFETREDPDVRPILSGAANTLSRQAPYFTDTASVPEQVAALFGAGGVVRDLESKLDPRKRDFDTEEVEMTAVGTERKRREAGATPLEDLKYAGLELIGIKTLPDEDFADRIDRRLSEAKGVGADITVPTWLGETQLGREYQVEAGMRFFDRLASSSIDFEKPLTKEEIERAQKLKRRATAPVRRRYKRIAESIGIDTEAK